MRAQSNRAYVHVQQPLRLFEVSRHDGQIELGGFPRRPWFSKLTDLKEGTTTNIAIGGDGRPVVGHVSMPVGGYAYRRGTLSAEVPIYVDNTHLFDIAADGTFLVPDMPAGKYHLRGEFARPVGLLHPISYRYLDFAAEGAVDFEIPPMPPGGSEEPVDIGEVPVRMNPHLSVGQPVAQITAHRLDGTIVRLSELRGKILLLQLWTAKRRYLVREQDQLKPIYDRFSDDLRFTMLSINLDFHGDDACAEAIKKGICWPQAVLADAELPKEYRNSGSSLYLIDSQGRLLASDIDGFDVWTRIKKALGEMP